MAEYIDRERLLRRFNIDDMMNVNGTLISMNDARDTISNFPTADVVEVTRCKDCRHHSAAAGVCNLYLHFSVGVTANDYCSFGERKTT